MCDVSFWKRKLRGNAWVVDCDIPRSVNTVRRQKNRSFRRCRSESRPSIFLATLGPLAEHTARVDFARNLFAAGGIEAKTAPAMAVSFMEGYNLPYGKIMATSTLIVIPVLIFALIDFASLRQLTHIHGVKSVEATRDLADELKRLKEKARKKKAKERASGNKDSEPGTPNKES